MPLFVGRQPEVGVLRSRLADALTGRPQVVLVQGPAGIGKSALIEQFLLDTRVEPAPVVVRAGGEEIEALLAYGVVEQLARSAGAAGAALLESVAGNGRTDPVTVGVHIVELLDGLDESTPVVLVVDDAHWADGPSLQALVFALRRLAADPVLAVLAVRDTADVELPGSVLRLVGGRGGSVLRLRGLDEEDLRDLAGAMGIDGLGPRGAQRLRFGTQGNPLHARALLQEFPPDRWGPQEQPLPSPRSFRLLVQDRYAACSAEARGLVDAAAVLGQRCPLPRAAALGEIRRPLEAADEAVRHGLLHASGATTPWELRFPHPLVRAAVYDALGLARRHALHCAAASLVTDRPAVLRHRVAAAAGPDEGLAGDLDRFACQEARRQAWQSAATHMIESSRFSASPEDARRRVLRALVWTLLRGDAATAATFADDVAASASGPLRDAVLASLAMAADDPATAERLLADAWGSRTPDEDREVVAIIALTAAIHWHSRLDAPATVEWCERALASTDPASSTHAAARAYLAHGLFRSGRTCEAHAATEPGQGRRGGAEHRWLAPRSARGRFRLVADDLDGARADLSAVAVVAAQRGVLIVASHAYAHLALAEYAAGAWDDAVMHAERAVAINVESDLAFLQSAVMGMAVLVPAGRGDWAAAEDHLQAMAHTDQGYERSCLAVGMARARIGEASGDAAAVLAALDPVRRFGPRDAVDEPGLWPWQDLYADALVAVGRVAEAGTFLVPHEERAQLRGRRSAQARLARSRGRVEAAAGRPERAEEAFTRALALTEDLGQPFERARIELAAGRFLRRAGQRRRAADLIAAAERRFLDLGARPYAQRCAQELRASGLTPARRVDRDPTALTSQELVVARLAARGRTNRELAEELFVSIKTVEYHLRNVFQKLGVSSRRELPDRLTELGGS